MHEKKNRSLVRPSLLAALNFMKGIQGSHTDELEFLLFPLSGHSLYYEII